MTKKKVVYRFNSMANFNKALDYLVCTDIKYKYVNGFILVSQTTFKKNPYLDLYLGAAGFASSLI